MNFGDNVKKELVKKSIKDVHCKKAFLSGLLRGTGQIFEQNGQIGLIFYVFSEQLINFVSDLFSELYSYNLREVDVAPDKLNKKDKFLITLSGESVYDILIDLGILKVNKGITSVNFDLFSDYGDRDCCVSNFLKGLFISSGSCTVPDDNGGNTGYHLEIVFSHPEPASQTNLKLSNYKIYGKVIIRKGQYVLYIKSAEEIKDFLALIHASVSVLNFTDIIIEKELKNNSNRRKNCDINNVNRQVEASIQQISAINKIIKVLGLDFLKDDLKSVAEFRLNNPDDTLVELADKMGISKSCLNHRLRKIISISNSL